MRIAVGIAGGSGAGKSTLARAIAACLPGEAVIVEYDWYYRDRGALAFDARAGLNYDHPQALDTPLLVRHLDALLAGESVEAPIYDFTRHARQAGTRRVEPAEVLIVEGLHTLCDAALCKRFAVKIFVETPPDLCFARRCRRDTLERGRTAGSVKRQFDQTVLPMYHRFVAPSSVNADRVIRGDEQTNTALEWIVPLIEAARNVASRRASNPRVDRDTANVTPEDE